MKSKDFIWVVYHGRFYDDGYFMAVFDVKKDAETAIKNQGYKYNAEQNLFLNYETETWYRLEREYYNCL